MGLSGSPRSSNNLFLSAELDRQVQPFGSIVDGGIVRMPLHQFLLAKAFRRILGLVQHYPAIPLLPSRPLAESASIVAAAPASPNASLSCTSTPASPCLEPASLHPSSTSASYLALRVRMPQATSMRCPATSPG
ncbi:hypothetical protein ZWY2020_039494 [Hordeum vulgare]|nr:hypothetical protein ZWY2020_039494 [Hordeum vulgare]